MATGTLVATAGMRCVEMLWQKTRPVLELRLQFLNLKHNDQFTSTRKNAGGYRERSFRDQRRGFNFGEARELEATPASGTGVALVDELSDEAWSSWAVR